MQQIDRSRRMKARVKYWSFLALVAALGCWEGCSWLYTIQILGRNDLSYAFNLVQSFAPIWGAVMWYSMDMMEEEESITLVSKSNGKDDDSGAGDGYGGLIRMSASALLGVSQFALVVLPFFLIKSHDLHASCPGSYACLSVPWLVVQGHVLISFIILSDTLYNLLLCLLVGVVCTCNYKGSGDGTPHPFLVTFLSLLIVFLCRLSSSLHALEVRARLPPPGLPTSNPKTTPTLAQP